MNKPILAITGLSGLLGRAIDPSNFPEYEIIDLFHNKPAKQIVRHVQVDLTESASINSFFADYKPQAFLHLAAITHIDRCQIDKLLGTNSLTWAINVNAVATISTLCGCSGIPLIYTSSECVFSGFEDQYNEAAAKDPINWYGYTKSIAEDLVLKHPLNAIIRGVILYDRIEENEIILWKILRKAKAGLACRVVFDQRLTPTFRPDLIQAVMQVLSLNKSGIFHACDDNIFTPFSMATIAADQLQIQSNLLAKCTINDFFDANAASLRLRNACLNNVKTKKDLQLEFSRFPQTMGAI